MNWKGLRSERQWPISRNVIEYSKKTKDKSNAAQPAFGLILESGNPTVREVEASTATPHSVQPLLGQQHLNVKSDGRGTSKYENKDYIRKPLIGRERGNDRYRVPFFYCLMLQLSEPLPGAGTWNSSRHPDYMGLGVGNSPKRHTFTQQGCVLL